MKWFHVITLMFSLQVGKVLLLSRCHAAKHVFITPKVLKQKRMYEGQREQLYQQQFNLENAAFTTQAIQDSVVQVQAMQAAGTELKKAFKAKELDINAIEKLQDEMSDLMDISNEINETLGQSYGVPDEIDESELMGELDALEVPTLVRRS